MSIRYTEAERLTQEWRSNVQNQLNSHSTKLEDLRKAMTQLMLDASTNKALGEVEARVRELEKFQVKTVTLLAVSQIIVAVIWALFVWLTKK